MPITLHVIPHVRSCYIPSGVGPQQGSFYTGLLKSRECDPLTERLTGGNSHPSVSAGPERPWAGLLQRILWCRWNSHEWGGWSSREWGGAVRLRRQISEWVSVSALHLCSRHYGWQCGFWCFCMVCGATEQGAAAVLHKELWSKVPRAMPLHAHPCEQVKLEEGQRKRKKKG